MTNTDQSAGVAGLRMLPTKHSVAKVLERLESLASARGIKIFARIDFSGDAAKSGLSMPASGLVILGNPKAGTPLMVAAPTVAIDLPLKMLAWEDGAGQTFVAYNEAEYLQKRHGFPPELMKNIAALSALVAAAAADEN